MFEDYDFWVVADNKHSLLFYGPKPEKIGNKWSSVYGPVGRLPTKKFNPADFKEPLHLTLYEANVVCES